MITMFAIWAGLMGSCAPRHVCRCPPPVAPLPELPASRACPPLSLGPEMPRQERVVVAAMDLSPGTRLRTSLLQIEVREPEALQAGHLRPVDIVHFAGRRVVKPIRKGRVVRIRDLEGLTAPVSSHKHSARPLPGSLIATVQVDFVGGRGVWIKKGDHVDLAVITRQAGSLSIKMLMQDAVIYAAQPWGRGTGSRSHRRWCSVVALPREAMALSLAQRLGRIVIFPRSVSDQRQAFYPPVTRHDLLNPSFWKRQRLLRERTIQRLRLPDDPGIRAK